MEVAMGVLAEELPEVGFVKVLAEDLVDCVDGIQCGSRPEVENESGNQPRVKMLLSPIPPSNK